MRWGENKTSLIEVINAEAIKYFRLKLFQIPSEMTEVTVSDMQRPQLLRRLRFVLQQNALSLTLELIMGITKKVAHHSDFHFCYCLLGSCMRI